MRVFVLDDDKWYRDFIKYHLELNPDLEVSAFGTAKELRSAFNENPDVICLDFQMPDTSGGDLMEEALKKTPNSDIVMISSQEDVGTAVQLLKSGAYDYIIKDDETADRLWNAMIKIKEKRELQDEVKTLRKEVKKKYNNGVAFVGSSSGILQVQALIEKAATTNISVSIFGETGTGKEVVAKSIHYNSSQSGPFVAVNVAAIPKELVESELFGHEKGAFTGANNKRIGKFEEANKGTLFLDEIGEMDLNMQSKLLRVLQEKEITRVGGSTSIKLDLRIVTATHRNLQEEVEAGRFRQDLYYRLMGLPISIPPLRERGNDIILLATHFINDFCLNNEIPKKSLDQSAKEKLKNHAFPGNVRELKALMDLAVVMSNGDEISATDINLNQTSGSINNLLNQEKTLKEYTALIVQLYIEKYNHNVIKAAKALGIGKSTIYRMIQANQIEVQS